jgi:hypothetical protein
MIYLIITTSINDKYGIKDYEYRKNRYLNSIGSVLNLLPKDNSIKPIIVENNGKRETYLDNFPCDIIYTYNNNLSHIHKGVNELLDIKEVIKLYNIDDNDIIIKLTGRYKIINDYFFNLVINNQDSFEGFIKFYNVCECKYVENDCVLGMFAVKSKYIKKFNYNCFKSPEIEFASYIRTSSNNIYNVDMLHLECCFAGDLRILNV